MGGQDHLGTFTELPSRICSYKFIWYQPPEFLARTWALPGATQCQLKDFLPMYRCPTRQTVQQGQYYRLQTLISNGLKLRLRWIDVEFVMISSSDYDRIPHSCHRSSYVRFPRCQSTNEVNRDSSAEEDSNSPILLLMVTSSATTSTSSPFTTGFK